MPFTDPDLEKFYAYSRLLVTKLRDENGSARFQIQDEVALEYYRIQKMSEGTIPLEHSGVGTLRMPIEVGTSRDESEEETLSTIIDVLNERFGTDFTASDKLFFDQIEHDLVRDPILAQQAKNNSVDNFKYPFSDVFISAVINRMEQNQEITDRIMNEDRFAEAVLELLLQKVYTQLQ
jgi:type I restriction enzyme R subunit